MAPKTNTAVYANASGKPVRFSKEFGAKNIIWNEGLGGSNGRKEGHLKVPFHIIDRLQIKEKTLCEGLNGFGLRREIKRL